MSPKEGKPAKPAERQRQVRVILEELIKKRKRGESFDPQQILDQYPDLADELAPLLQDMPRVIAARPSSRETVTPTDSDFSQTQSADVSSRPRGRLPRIPGYEIESVLGQGGMGIVYKARQENLNRIVALKVLPGIVGDASSSAVTRFRREATAAARLHHTNIIPVYDFGEAADCYYYTMELVRGQPMDKLVGRLGERSAASASNLEVARIISQIVHERDPSDELPEWTTPRAEGSDSSATISRTGRKRPYFHYVARWIAEAADALHYAHSQRIIHRDVKPSNIILSVDGRVMVADFGLAKSSDEQTMTMTGSLLGTVRYLSPEQAMAKRVSVDHRTDIYSLGATMYELLCFAPAFPGSDEKQVLAHIITREPIPPRKILPIVPIELETICHKALEKNPDARYQSAAELGEDLRRFLQDMPVHARRPSVIRKTRKFVRRHRFPVIASLALLFAVAGSGYGITQWRAKMDAQEKELLANRRARAAEADRLITASKALTEEGRWDEARQHLDEALELAPENVEALTHKAYMLAIRAKSVPRESSESILQELESVSRVGLALDPKNGELQNYLALALKRQHRYSEAADVLLGCAGEGSTDVSCLGNMAIIVALDGRIEEAAELLGRATQLSQEGGLKPWHVDCWRNLAVVETYLGRTSALKHVDMAIQCDRSRPGAWLVKSLALLKLGNASDLSAALEYSRMANELAAPDAHLIRARAMRISALCRLRLQQSAVAHKDAEVAMELGDLPSYGLLVQAVASAQLKELDLAIEVRNRAVRAWSDDLIGDDAIQITAESAFIWIDSATELRALEAKLEDLLSQAEEPEQRGRE